MTQTTETTAQGLPQLRGDLPLPLRSLLDAGVHFGHQTKRWNPKMRPFIYGARNGIHIIDLDQTARLFARAYNFVVDTVARGGHILMVGTKRQAQEIVREEAHALGSFFVVNRWLGGTLTNFRTIKTGLERMRQLERMKEDGTYQSAPEEGSLAPREGARALREVPRRPQEHGLAPAARCSSSIRRKETIAVQEANKLGIPVIAITDTNCDPDMIDFVIPGNDDAIRSIKLITARIADAVVEGSQRRKEFVDRDDHQGGGAVATGRRPRSSAEAAARRDDGGDRPS